MLKGDKDRVEALGQKEVGIIVKCYCGLENTVKVCDLVEILGILEMPEENDEDMGVVVHAVTMRKKQLNEIILAKQGQLSTSISICPCANSQPTWRKRRIYLSNISRIYSRVTHWQQNLSSSICQPA